jgi:hypothetical protein
VIWLPLVSGKPSVGKKGLKFAAVGTGRRNEDIYANMRRRGAGIARLLRRRIEREWS